MTTWKKKNFKKEKLKFHLFLSIQTLHNNSLPFLLIIAEIFLHLKFTCGKLNLSAMIRNGTFLSVEGLTADKT